MNFFMHFLNTTSADSVPYIVWSLSICNTLTSSRQAGELVHCFRESIPSFILDTFFLSIISQQNNIIHGKQYNSELPPAFIAMLIFLRAFEDSDNYSSATCSEFVRRFRFFVSLSTTLLSSTSVSLSPGNRYSVFLYATLKAHAASLAAVLSTSTYRKTICSITSIHLPDE